MDITHLLIRFGLTHQEAQVYQCLYASGQATGYELAKATGISRSNTYAGLSSLVEKGAAYRIDGKPVRYVAVVISEFCRNVIHGLQDAQHTLEERLPQVQGQEDGYLTIVGSGNIQRKIETLIDKTRYRIYLSMNGQTLASFLPSLQELADRGCKVVVITDTPVELSGATVYLTGMQVGVIRLIADSSVALTGGLDDSPLCSCLYSAKENLVSLLKDSMKNEIQLIQLAHPYNKE